MSKVIVFKRDRKRVGGAGVINDEAENRHASQVQADRRANGPAPILQRRDSARRPLPARDIAISVVVPTKGRPQLLNRCIASLVLQRFAPGSFEIIVVDDGPDPETRRIVADWSTHTEGGGPLITYLASAPPHGPAAARNRGWRAARSDIIAFTDDDTIARSDWLQNGLLEFGQDDVHAVRGRIVMPLSGTPTDYQLDAKNLETAEFVTANCFCRKHVLEDIGGFDERFLSAWREDSDLYFRLIDYSANIVHSPRTVMVHPIRPANWGVSLSQLKKIQFDALLYKKHRQLYRQRIRTAPRWDFYVTVSALFACMAALLAESLPAAVASGLLWLLMTGRFCTQRLQHTSKAPSHVAEMVVTSMLIPPLAVFWRAVGAFKFRAGLL